MKRFNIWIVLLLASVLVNGVLLGAGARSWFAPVAATAPSADQGPGRGFDLRAFVEALPEDARAEARSRARAERRALREDLRSAARARIDAYRALNAEPFDPVHAAEALNDARVARAAIEARTEAMILDIAAGLSPDERQAALRAALGPPRFPHRSERGVRRLDAADDAQGGSRR